MSMQYGRRGVDYPPASLIVFLFIYIFEQGTPSVERKPLHQAIPFFLIGLMASGIGYDRKAFARDPKTGLYPVVNKIIDGLILSEVLYTKDKEGGWICIDRIGRTRLCPLAHDVSPIRSASVLALLAYSKGRKLELFYKDGALL